MATRLKLKCLLCATLYSVAELYYVYELCMYVYTHHKLQKTEASSRYSTIILRYVITFMFVYVQHIVMYSM